LSLKMQPLKFLGDKHLFPSYLCVYVHNYYKFRMCMYIYKCLSF
jgi:hypothetical protein